MLSETLSVLSTDSHDTDTDAVVLNMLPPEVPSEVSAVLGQDSEPLRDLHDPSCLPLGLWLEVLHVVSCLANTSCCGLAGLGVIASEERFDAGQFGLGDREWAPVLDVAVANGALTTAHGGVNDVRCVRCLCNDAEPIAMVDCLLRGVRINGPGSATRACGPSSALAALLVNDGPGNSRTEGPAVGRGDLGCEGDFTPCR